MYSWSRPARAVSASWQVTAAGAASGERRRVESDPMYLIAIAWLYVVLLVAVADTTVIGGVLTFAFWGLAPLALFLWLLGTPARRRSAARRAREPDTDAKDRADSGPDQ